MAMSKNGDVLNLPSYQEVVAQGRLGELAVAVGNEHLVQAASGDGFIFAAAGVAIKSDNVA